ncbi:hypothetical protein [Pseudoalteromonas rubra]|uniref:hypothetical protein n=1 Tax=Pseudoalteromonas rubra TaxID=43658 RepID=UPI002DBC44EC|nr:hypothetical protein [Pseudoalteromonas rubra]MEC4090905.1 hypothetical protein [Pseudoalteromonas rubra]
MKKIISLSILNIMTFLAKQASRGTNRNISHSKDLYCDQVFGGATAKKPPREASIHLKTEGKAQQNSPYELTASAYSSVSGGATPFKPPRKQYAEENNRELPKVCLCQLSTEMCVLIAGGNTAYKPPRAQSIEIKNPAETPKDKK